MGVVHQAQEQREVRPAVYGVRTKEEEIEKDMRTV